jgi:hypothetical protein
MSTISFIKGCKIVGIQQEKCQEDGVSRVNTKIREGKKGKLTSSRRGVDKLPAATAPLPAAFVLGFFLNARGLGGRSVVSRGVFGSSEMTSV